MNKSTSLFPAVMASGLLAWLVLVWSVLVWSVLVGSIMACLVVAPGVSRAATLVYLTADGLGQGAAPISPQETLKFLPDGGSFHIWVLPDTHSTGISLDVETTGSAILFTGATVHNPSVGSDTRWLTSLIRHGTVTTEKVTRIEGGALAPLFGFGRGMGVPTSSSDPLYETSGGFLFATIDYAAPNPTELATVSLSIGHNLLSDTTGLVAGPIFLGVDDGPVANDPGATGTAADLNFVPRPLHPADFDSDGYVGGADFLTWQTGFGITSGATRALGDADGDGQVDAADLVLWESQFGTKPAGALATTISVPESTTCTLALFGATAGLAALGRQQRNCLACPC